MHRIFCKDIDLSRPQAILTDPKQIHHLVNVLRHKKGDRVEIFSAHGQAASGTLAEVSKTKVVIEINARLDAPSGAACQIILACAIPKKAKFETIIEKCTELGVSEIIPLKTARTEMKLSADRLLKKFHRYEQVAVSAAKQCRRTSLPLIRPIATFAEALEALPEDSVRCIPWLEGERRPLVDVLKDHVHPKSVVFLIGPEGDFTPSEVQLARQKGFLPVSLGPTTLKVDTAAMVVVALANLFYNR